MALFKFGIHRYDSKKAAVSDIRAIRRHGTDLLIRHDVPHDMLVRMSNPLHQNKLIALFRDHHPLYRADLDRIGGEIRYLAWRQNPMAACPDAQVLAIGPTGHHVMSTVMPFRVFDPLQQWFDAMRAMVSDQTRTWITGLECPIICSASGEPLVHGKAQVDHFPKSFIEIALDFLETHYQGGLRIYLSHYTPARHYDFFSDLDCQPGDGWFADADLVHEWQDYHRQHATYRPLSGPANASAGQQVKVVQAERLAAMRAIIGTHLAAA